ncbi:MAG: 23S rRNA (pseudouridine(1915)-N(3))-methyltransferase RlmH [Alphaproteobacteria bacterium]
MRITIVAVGRLRAGPEQTLVDHFAKRISWPLEIREVEEKKNLTGDALKRREGELLLENCPTSSQIIALDERGREISSRAFAKKVSDWQDEGIGDLSILIGGADGLDDAVRKRANLTISFGRLTWPHMVVRGLLVEQLYRAQQIIAGHPYHRD